MKQNKRIAVTGGMGSGKSTVLKIIAQTGYGVYSCDEVYSDLLRSDEFLNELCKMFGNVLTPDGRLDRKKLAEIVFSDENALKRLNSFTHPKIYAEMFARAKKHGGLCFFEVPLLFEDGAQNMFDGVVVVARDEADRVASVIKRDSLTEDEVKHRIINQFDYKNIDFTKYYVIHNNGDLVHLRAEVQEILEKIENDYIK